MFVAAAAVNDDNAAADAAMNDAAMNDAAAVDVAFAAAADVAEADSAVAASASLDLNAGTAANAPSFADNMLRTNHAASFFCSSPLQTEVSFQRNDWGLDIEVSSPSQMNGQLEWTDENATTFERQILSPS